MIAMRHLVVVLALLGAGGAMAQTGEQAYAAKAEAARRADIDQRIAARWSQLAQDPGAPVIGNPNADVTIVEFSDYNCPYCKAMEPRLEALLKADRRVKLVLMEYPFSRRPRWWAPAPRWRRCARAGMRNSTRP